MKTLRTQSIFFLSINVHLRCMLKEFTNGVRILFLSRYIRKSTVPALRAEWARLTPHLPTGNEAGCVLGTGA